MTLTVQGISGNQPLSALALDECLVNADSCRILSRLGTEINSALLPYARTTVLERACAMLNPQTSQGQVTSSPEPM